MRLHTHDDGTVCLDSAPATRMGRLVLIVPLLPWSGSPPRFSLSPQPPERDTGPTTSISHLLALTFPRSSPDP